MPFRLWVLLREHFDPAAYDGLFDRELDAVWPTLQDAEARRRLAAMRGFGWTNYVLACLRNAGYHEQGRREELAHDVVVRLLVQPGGLFHNYDERRHGPFDLRFKRSVSNAIKNLVALERTRRKRLPDSGTEVDDLPSRPEPSRGPTLTDRFRKLLQARLGDLAVAVFDARAEGRQTKDLVGLPELNRPGRFVVKKVVGQIKAVAREFAETLGDPDFLRQVERLMDAEAATIARRTATTRLRRTGTERTT